MQIIIDLKFNNAPLDKDFKSEIEETLLDTLQDEIPILLDNQLEYFNLELNASYFVE